MAERQKAETAGATGRGRTNRRSAGSGQGSPRWRRRAAARPAEIVAAALEVFAARGFAAARLDDIAARAGVTRGTLYLYFPDKAALFKAAIRQSIVPVLARAEVMADADELAGGTAAALLRRVVEFLPDAVLGGPAAAIPKLVIAEAGNFPDIARFYLDEVIERGRRLIGGILRRGIAAGEFRAVDVDHVVYSVIAPVLLAALWQHSFRPYDARTIDPHALSRAHAEVLLHGLSARGDGAGGKG